MRYIFAYNESGYNGEYEYRYDPEHKNKPEGEGWYITNHGWARGTDKSGKSGHEPTKPFKIASVVKPSLEHRMKIAKNSEHVDTFVSSGIANCFSASNEVIKQLGNSRNIFKEIDDLILGYADKEKPKVEHKLSTLMGYLFHLSPDFRNEEKPIDNYDEIEMEHLKKYIINEQEIIRMSGLVNDDDTITLYRNTDDIQFLSNNYKLSDDILYKGNNFESWSTNPGLKFSPDGKPKKKIMAHVPISACIASCIGRQRPFMFKNRGECEIMVCAAFINNVMYVGNLKGIKIPGFRENHLIKMRSNMQRFANQNRNKKASVSFDRRMVAKELIKIARELMSN